MNHSQQWLFRLSLVAMAFMVGCGALGGGDPEVYLVKDSRDTFHFQWNEPPVTDRIILVRITYTLSGGVESEFEYELVLFRAGSVQSPRILAFSTGNYDAFSYPPGDSSGIVTITILPFKELRNFSLPATTYDIESREVRELLIGYPFESYDVGEPSELTFNYVGFYTDYQ